jgi:hypothetical protein
MAFGERANANQVVNLVSNTGVLASNSPNVPGVTNKTDVAATTYGGDKAIFMSGSVSINLVSNTGVLAADTPIGAGVSARGSAAGASYGGNKGIFGFGNAQFPLNNTNVTNLVSTTGVIAANTPGVGTSRRILGAATYGSNNDRAIFGFGSSIGVADVLNITNLVSNTGVVASDTPGVGTSRKETSGTGYGNDKAIFAYGVVAGSQYTNVSNLVSNTGVVASDSPGVGGVRSGRGAAGYGGDKAIFTFGQGPSNSRDAVVNLVSNTGVVAADTPYSPATITGRHRLAGAGYSFT